MAPSHRFTVAIHVLSLLALRKPGEETPICSAALAESVGTNPVVVRRLLKQLAQAGLVRCVPGKSGGALLARSPTRITLLDIYEAVEPGSLFCAPSKPANRSCLVSRGIGKAIAPAVRSAEESARSTLGRATLMSVIKRLA